MSSGDLLADAFFFSLASFLHFVVSKRGGFLCSQTFNFDVLTSEGATPERLSPGRRPPLSDNGTSGRLHAKPAIASRRH